MKSPSHGYILVWTKSTTVRTLKSTSGHLCDRKRWHFLQNPSIILHENARLPIAQTVADVFAPWGWNMRYYPPDSSNLRPFDLISSSR